MTAKTRWIILACAAVGLGFAGASAWVHYKLLTDPTYVSPCDISATFNCSQVYMSRYGSFQGVSVALGGLFWFALVGLLAAFSPVTAPGTKSTNPVGGYIFALATIGLAVILYLGYASFFVLKTGCLLCMGTYVSVIGIFLASGLTASANVGSLPGRLARDLKAVFDDPATLTVGVLLLASTASAVAFFPKEGHVATVQATEMTDEISAAFTQAWEAQSRRDLGIPAEGADVLVVKFVDWQCPSCKAASFAYKPIYDKFEASHPGKVREVVRDYPLSSRCNYNMGSEGHISACEAAAAVRMARGVGRAEEMISWFFTQPDQQGITPAMVKAETQQMLGITDFDARYAAMLDSIRQDTADGRALNVNSTPTYFVNGVLAQTPEGWLHPQLFELALKIELEKADTTGR
jgi:uncharacterized membrane protein/protein-disulfide isomerase